MNIGFQESGGYACTLEPNHTHFLLVDHGSSADALSSADRTSSSGESGEGRVGKLSSAEDVALRGEVERYCSKQFAVPLIYIVLQVS